MIYLDNASTTKVDSSVFEEFKKYSLEEFYNPSAIYKSAVDVKSKINEARQVILKNLGASQNDTIIFTGSATEANNMALLGSVRSNTKKIILSYGDHPSTFNVGKSLQEKGYDVQFCPLQQNGQVDYDKLEQMLDDSVSIVSVIHVSNETGAINDLKRIHDMIARKCKNAIFHADGVQALSKVKINLDYFGVDLYTISGHKMFAPKGIGCLYIKNKVLVKPIIFGGGQELAIRSGTENVAAIMALKKAVENIGNIKENWEYVSSLKKMFISNIKEYAQINSNDDCSPYVLSLSFDGVKGETLVHLMEQNNILISTGSACSTKKAGNRILESMGVSQNKIIGSVRISFSKYNTLNEVELASETLAKCYKSLKEKLS